MNNLPTDGNSRAIQCANLGNGNNYTTGKLPADIRGLVRFKNIGEDNAVIRYSGDTTDGVVLSPGETEYFFVNGIVEVVEGTVNIMY